MVGEGGSLPSHFYFFQVTPMRNVENHSQHSARAGTKLTKKHRAALPSPQRDERNIINDNSLTHTIELTQFLGVETFAEKDLKSKYYDKLVRDVSMIDINMDSAYDCIKRLEESWINAQLKVLRENLKNAEASNQDPISIMKQIDNLQKEKNKLSHPSSSNEI